MPVYACNHASYAVISDFDKGFGYNIASADFVVSSDNVFYLFEESELACK